MTLSPREEDVARLIAAGETDKQIAAALGISQQRVSQIVYAIVAAWELDANKNVRVQITAHLLRVA